MTELIREVECNTADEFLAALTPWANNEHFGDRLHKYIFRGHSDDRNKLIPSALRKRKEFCKLGSHRIIANYESETLNQISYEYNIIRKFYNYSDRNGLYLPNVGDIRKLLIDSNTKKYALPVEHLSKWALQESINKEYFLWPMNDLMEISGIAQHHNLQTRLLDWTYDPLVAAYFSAKRAKKDTYITVWALQKDFIEVTVKELPDEKDLHDGIGRLKFINPPYHENPNLAAQAGLFTCWQIPVQINENGPIDNLFPVDRNSLDKVIYNHIYEYIENAELAQHLINKIFVKITTHSCNAKRVLYLLNTMNYNAARLFPGYDGVVQQMHDEIFDPYPDE